MLNSIKLKLKAFDHRLLEKSVNDIVSAVERAGMNTLREGQKVEYELVTGQNGKTSAENLVALD